jgi:hypothetical protein
MFVSQRCVITLLSAGTLIEFNKTFTLPSLSPSQYTAGPAQTIGPKFCQRRLLLARRKRSGSAPIGRAAPESKVRGGGGKLCGETTMKFEGEEERGEREEGVCPIM